MRTLSNTVPDLQEVKRHGGKQSLLGLKRPDHRSERPPVRRERNQPVPQPDEALAWAWNAGTDTLTGSWGAGPHDVGVQFINDAWGGTPTTDRNLYVNTIDVNGTAMPGTAATLLGTSTQHFAVLVAAHVRRPAGPWSRLSCAANPAHNPGTQRRRRGV